MFFLSKAAFYYTSSRLFSSTFRRNFRDSFQSYSLLFWKMKAGKQLVPAFYLFLDSWCISSAITIWTFSSGSLPLPADLPQVPQCHLQIHSGHYSYSRNFLFFHPLLVFLTLTHSVPPGASVHLTSFSQRYPFIEHVLNLTAPCEVGREGASIPERCF